MKKQKPESVTLSIYDFDYFSCSITQLRKHLTKLAEWYGENARITFKSVHEQYTHDGHELEVTVDYKRDETSKEEALRIKRTKQARINRIKGAETKRIAKEENERAELKRLKEKYSG